MPDLDPSTLLAAQFHEIKNQLGQLALNLDEIALDRPELAQVLKPARDTSRAIIDRLVQALTLYKHGQNQLRLNVEAHSPTEFIHELAAEAKSLGAGRLSIAVNCDAAPPFWFFDRYLAGVAMLNAVHNALEHARTRIELGARRVEDGLCLYVGDDSDGYPAHILDNPGFEPNSSSRGTGLGLYFAQTIARAHQNHGQQGRLHLRNEAGAVFSLWLP